MTHLHRHPATDVVRLHQRSRLLWPDGTSTLAETRLLDDLHLELDCRGRHGFGTAYEQIILARGPILPNACSRCPIRDDCIVNTDPDSYTTNLHAGAAHAMTHNHTEPTLEP